MKFSDDNDFGGPLNAAAWVCVFVIPLCLVGVVIGAPDVADKAQKILIGDFGLLTAFIGLKTVAISRRSHHEDDRRDAGGGRNG